MNNGIKRKVCFIITSFIHYSRNLLILEELNNRNDIDLHVIIAGSVLLPKYSSKYANIKNILEKDGFENIYEIHFSLEGSNQISQAKTSGLGIIEFASLFNQIGPDLIVARGDRYEVLSAVTAAAHMNIPIAHIEGGDVTGTIDESIRHAITKLAHIHFATNDDAKNRIIKMGENPEYVFNFGSPDVEVVHKFVNSAEENGIDIDVDLSLTGSGSDIDFNNNFLMVMYHPVTTEVHNLKNNTKILLETIHEIGIPTLWFWPNYDVGSEEISHELRIFKDEVPNHKIKFMRYLPPKKFISLLNGAKCLIGNSSAGIKECSYLGVPVVDVGSRQNNRLQADNVVNVDHDKEEIKKVIYRQMEIGRYPVSDLYFGNDSSKKIADKIATVDLYIQKSFFDNE